MPIFLTARPWAVSLAILLFCGCFRQVIRDVVVEVPEMKASDCAGIIQDALSRVDGVISATPDTAAGVVTVRYDSEKLGTKNVEYVIAGAGFTANGIPRNAEARAKLPQPCQ